MSADNRSVHTDALATLGTIIDDKQARDAIHLAVEPVIAGEHFRAGDHVALKDGLAVKAARDYGLGIVDPFLSVDVKPGDRFWLVVYPRQITSLRHVWTHPSFPDAETTAATPDGTKSESEQWMRAWAKEHMGYDYYGDSDTRSDDDAYESAIYAGHNNHVGPYEDARDHIDNEWWHHWETITGEKGDRDSYFSCAC